MHIVKNDTINIYEQALKLYVKSAATVWELARGLKWMEHPNELSGYVYATDRFSFIRVPANEVRKYPREMPAHVSQEMMQAYNCKIKYTYGQFVAALAQVPENDFIEKNTPSRYITIHSMPFTPHLVKRLKETMDVLQEYSIDLVSFSRENANLFSFASAIVGLASCDLGKGNPINYTLIEL